MDANGTPDMEGSAKDTRDQHESQRVEIELMLLAIGEASEAEDLKVERRQMEHQLRLVQIQTKGIVDARPRGEELDKLEFEQTIYSANS